MRRVIPAEEKQKVIELMLYDQLGQREIDRLTNVSRPTIKKIADEIGYKFQRNGIEIISSFHICFNCGAFFKRANSRIYQDRIHCCLKCVDVTRSGGEGHYLFQTSDRVEKFPIWFKNQPQYKEWEKAVYKRYKSRCALSGRFDNLLCFHVFTKYEKIDIYRAFSVENSILICEDVYKEALSLIRQHFTFEEVIEYMENQYKYDKKEKVWKNKKPL